MIFLYLKMSQDTHAHTTTHRHKNIQTHIQDGPTVD